MATASRSTGSSTRTLNGASRAGKRIARRAESSTTQFTNFLSRESSNLAKRAGNLYSTTAKAAKDRPVAAVGIVTGIAALIGGLWYAARNR